MGGIWACAGELKNKRTNGHHQKNLQSINAGEGVEKREPSYTVGGNVNWYSHYGDSSKNEK